MLQCICILYTVWGDTNQMLRLKTDVNKSKEMLVLWKKK